MGRKMGILVCAEYLLPSCCINAVLYAKLGRHMVDIGIKVGLMKTNSMGDADFKVVKLVMENRGAGAWAF